MIIVHTAENPQALVNISHDKNNIRRRNIFDEAGHESEEVQVHEDSSRFTAKDLMQLVSTVRLLK